jgi:hypothetical protein
VVGFPAFLALNWFRFVFPKLRTYLCPEHEEGVVEDEFCGVILGYGVCESDSCCLFAHEEVLHLQPAWGLGDLDAVDGWVEFDGLE